MKYLIKLTLISSFFILSASIPQTTHAQSEKFIGDIELVGFNFCRRGTLPADGRLLSIAQNTALFSLYGTTFGGDGRTTMGLPDLRGRAAIGEGRGPGLADYRLGQRGGVETVTLTQAEMPTHTHSASIQAAEDGPNSSSPSGAAFAESQIFNNEEAPSAEAALNTASVLVNPVGGSQSHENRMPALTMNYCVVVVGLFPSRN